MLLSVVDEPAPELRPWPGEPESLVVTADTGDRLHFLDWGGATADRSPLPPVLLIHGLGATSWIWAPVARRLRGATRVVATDLRGHGLSDSARSGYDLESLAYDALTVLVAMGWGTDAGGRPAVVAGHGLGAMVAATMATVQPDSIAGVALIDGGWEDVAQSTGMTASEFERSIGDPPEVLASMDAYVSDRREFDPDSWDADQERAARSAVDEKHAGHVASVVRPFALHASVDAMFEYRPLDALSEITAPLLVAVAESGTADDEVAIDRRAALADVMRARAAARLQPASVRRFPGAGHNLMRYRPRELTVALIELLTEAAHQRS
jgi:pimeloyl-ACP methyl ester carboxylesterase